MFDADRPIQNSAQDQLGRSIFAKYLARCILNHSEKESIVIGLYGASGTGKTSLINLALEELHTASNNLFDHEKPIILNFSAWSYSGQGQLIYSFFRRLSSELRSFPYLENADRIIELLELYVSFFTHQPVPVSLQLKRSVLKKIPAFSSSKDTAFGWESGRDLTQVKAELNELLSQQKHKIIIFIDNISRLEDDEIKQIFQIVKSIGDFSNTVYTLSLEKEEVEHALKRIHSSARYLEKIVQMPFEVPNISTQDLENILFSRLKKITALLPQESWSTEYWADIYYSSLRYFFRQFRDVVHYANTLSFSFSYVKDVVNPVDFFALTALYVFEPRVYAGIRDNKDLFTDLVDNVIQFTKEKLAEDKSRCDEVLNRSEKISTVILKPLLFRLFPRLRDIYQADFSFYHSETLARKNRRISSPDVFDAYFRLSIPAGYLSQAEMTAILSSAYDEEGFALALMRLNQDQRIVRFLGLLDGAAINAIPASQIGSVVSALMDSADLFPEGESSLVQLTTPMRVHRIFHQLLKRVKTTAERFAIFSEAIKKADKSLYIVVHELIQQNREHLESEEVYLPLEHRDFTLVELQSLQTLAAEKIVYWADTERLFEHPKLLPILYAWKAWGNSEDCKNYVDKLTYDDKGLLAFLGAALKEPIDQAMIKVEKSPEWASYLQNIENFIPIKTLEPRAKKLFEELSFEKLREREQLALLIFLDLIHADTTKIIPKTTA